MAMDCFYNLNWQPLIDKKNKINSVYNIKNALEEEMKNKYDMRLKTFDPYIILNKYVGLSHFKLRKLIKDAIESKQILSYYQDKLPNNILDMYFNTYDNSYNPNISLYNNNGRGNYYNSIEYKNNFEKQKIDSNTLGDIEERIQLYKNSVESLIN